MNKTKNGGTRTNHKSARGAPPPRLALGAGMDVETSSEELPSQEAVQARFDLAVQEGVSPCLWIPPQWEFRPLDRQPKRFPDNTSDPNGFVGKNAQEEAEIRLAIQERLKAGNAIKSVQNAEEPPTESTWPNPFADTSHIDDTEFPATDVGIMNKLMRGTSSLEKLNVIVGPDAPGMARLKRIFEWALHRTSVLMSDLNRSLRNRETYEKARENYIHFLRDIDDHEPEKGPKKSPREREAGKAGRPTKLDPRNKLLASGYGRSLKWTCIDPVIFEGKIVGTRVVVKWNPHISSSGIPINH